MDMQKCGAPLWPSLVPLYALLYIHCVYLNMNIRGKLQKILEIHFWRYQCSQSQLMFQKPSCCLLLRKSPYPNNLSWSRVLEEGQFTAATNRVFSYMPAFVLGSTTAKKFHVYLLMLCVFWAKFFAETFIYLVLNWLHNRVHKIQVQSYLIYLRFKTKKLTNQTLVKENDLPCSFPLAL